MGILNLSVVEEAHKMKIFFFVCWSPASGQNQRQSQRLKLKLTPSTMDALGHNLGYAGLTYGYPTYGYRTYAYPGVYSGYGYHSIGKREAEAEPKAEADPEAYYAAYGYAAPYAYGYNRLGYSRLGYGYSRLGYGLGGYRSYFGYY